jgi:hypothetical protein
MNEQLADNYDVAAPTEAVSEKVSTISPNHPGYLKAVLARIASGEDEVGPMPREHMQYLALQALSLILKPHS